MLNDLTVVLSEGESYTVEFKENPDKVFLLTEAQCRQYFADDEAMVAQYNGESVSWWTLTPGNDLSGRVCTYGDGGGGLYMTGNQVTTAEGCGVRPAIWIDITPKTESSSEQ